LALPSVTVADPPAPADNAFIKHALPEANLCARKKYDPTGVDFTGYPKHKHKDPWVDAAGAKVQHKLDAFTKRSVPTAADVIWQGQTSEGIPYDIDIDTEVNADGSFRGTVVIQCKLGHPKIHN
jgi:hypothetical protein